MSKKLGAVGFVQILASELNDRMLADFPDMESSVMATFSAPTNFRKQTVFPHDTQNRFGITLDASKTACLLFRTDFCKGYVFLQSDRTMGEITVSLRDT